MEGSSDHLREVRHILLVPSDNAVSNGGYYITQQQLQLERAREVEQRLMTELQQLTREKEQVCSSLTAVPYKYFMIITAKAIVSLTHG